MTGYDVTDPKHPGYAERMFDRADDYRSHRNAEPVNPETQSEEHQ